MLDWDRDGPISSEHMGKDFDKNGEENRRSEKLRNMDTDKFNI